MTLIKRNVFLMYVVSNGKINFNNRKSLDKNESENKRRVDVRHE